MQIGVYHELEVAKEVPFGVYLNSPEGEILLPAKYIPEGLKVGDTIKVFIYRDSEDRLIATTLKPYGQLNEFVALQVTDLAPHGAYMDWGLEKDLLVPTKEQPFQYQIGDFQVVRICMDYKTDRLIGVGKIVAFLDKDTSFLNEGQEVQLLIYAETELGYMAVVDQSHAGLIYKNEVFQPLRVGDQLKGYIKMLREDGKIDLRVGKVGVEAIDVNADKVMEVLKRNNGTLPLHDKSEPDEITRWLKMSKKSFKKAIGTLYKKKLIELTSEGIKLVE